MVILGVAFLTLRNGGIEWASRWVNWVIILVFPIPVVLFAVWASGGLAAGAEWLRYGRNWIKIYELTGVKLGESQSSRRLVLKDVDGRDFSMSLKMLQRNPELWDLVYNGILYSVCCGSATVNETAREKLRLDPQLHFIHDEDSQNEPDAGP